MQQLLTVAARFVIGRDPPASRRLTRRLIGSSPPIPAPASARYKATTAGLVVWSTSYFAGRQEVRTTKYRRSVSAFCRPRPPQRLPTSVPCLHNVPFAAPPGGQDTVARRQRSASSRLRLLCNGVRPAGGSHGGGLAMPVHLSAYSVTTLQLPASIPRRPVSHISVGQRCSEA